MNIITIPVQGSFRNTLNNQSLRIFEKTEWGSHNSEHRLLIRNFLFQQSRSNNSQILDLNNVPIKIDDKYCSITHTLDQGLIVVCDSPVGIDLEKTQRIQTKIVARVSSEKELQRAPSAAALWCAKESAFKALRNFEQPEVLSQLEIGGWRESQDGLVFFELKNSEDFAAPQGRGAFYQSDSLSLAIFTFSS